MNVPYVFGEYFVDVTFDIDRFIMPLSPSVPPVVLARNAFEGMTTDTLDAIARAILTSAGKRALAHFCFMLRDDETAEGKYLHALAGRWGI